MTTQDVPGPSHQRAEGPVAGSMAGPVARQRRQEYVAPLFAYCVDHCLGPLWLARRAAIRSGGMEMTKMRLWRIKNGAARIPDWFIAGMCREIGQPVEVVMGQEWAQQHLPAPSGEQMVEQKAEQKAS